MTVEAKRLAVDWECIRHGYYPGSREDIDAVVLDCVDRLGRARAARRTGRADPAGTAFAALGLVLMSGYVAWDPGPGVADRSVAALLDVAGDAREPCDHPDHPADEDDVETLLELLPQVLKMIGDPAGGHGGWDDFAEESAAEDESAAEEESAADAESRWRCPHNIAAFAVAAAETIRPGSTG
ncbi:hypothetical protein HUT19_13125 [Streptomyces sp. NA02950]|uniref:hypothetical protein n=1 Tax=Streptomyces sp. NA02950 TaxID=2742137 RepID=UPI001590C61E|nr:hypothetical protein [Streptomyces sp. NA02950]QKV92574.1 hypothetical protein HUT19_13125 [Streptomyces sp. NA02950]